jgi:succinate-acetate transporter protein
MNKDKIQMSTNKSFGIIFFIFFLILSLYPLLSKEKLNLLFLIFAITFLLLGILNSKILTPLNKLWFKFGIILGKVISPIIMGIIFFLVVTPIGLIMKVLGKDLLRLKFNKKDNTYWIEKNGPKSKMKNQF